MLNELNSKQQEAVCAPIGPLLVLAGAGSGKTRVLVRRIAWLIENYDAWPSEVLAVTFTNKAAGEMKERLSSMIRQDISSMWVGTFHGLAHKMLRQYYEAAGLPQSFQVIDSEDQLSAIRRIIRQLEIDEEQWEPKKAQYYINRKKDEGVRPEHIVPAQSHETVLIEIYKVYESLCRNQGLVDFAELLLRSYELLQKPEILQQFQKRFRHILVDEFQDTNTIQYLWLKLISAHAESVTVVGDDDQSIYGWRGAKVENIQKFEDDYPGCNVVRLEQNYRSTHTILEAANAVISNNSGRMGKNLWTETNSGEPINVYGALNEEDEALYIVRQIQKLQDKGESLKDVAVLYRSNAQSRVLEDAFVRVGIPYVIYGGMRFFERAEIKDAMAYLRLALNNEDSASFERVINTPPRGIGIKSVEKIRQVASDANVGLLQAASISVSEGVLVGKARMGVESFISVISNAMQKVEESPLADIIATIIQESGLLTHFKEQKGEKAQSRAENLEELVNATGDFVVEDENGKLLDRRETAVQFVSYAALDSGDAKKEDEDSVQMMTLHSAKGLEYTNVFLCGLEEGLFPHYLAKDDPNGIEEERRLCYVGITRAMRNLNISYAFRRRLFGREELRQVSRFIDEIPAGLRKDRTRKMEIKPPQHYRMPIAPSNSNYTPRSKPGRVSSVKVGNDSGYTLGQRVAHKKFGPGVVVDFEGDGSRGRINIQFESVGSKWLALEYAKLEVLN